MVTTLALALALALPLAAQDSALQADEKLRVPITVHAKIVSAAEFVVLLQRGTGAKIEVAPLDADRKLTVICTARPASEVMERVAEALFMDWTYDKRRDTWHLELIAEVRKEEEAARKAAREQDVRAIRLAVQSLGTWETRFAPSPTSRANPRPRVCRKPTAAALASGGGGTAGLRDGSASLTALGGGAWPSSA